MKANAPEKLYYAPYGDIREDYPITDDDIEYIRTDAFIEKAKKWMLTHTYMFQSMEEVDLYIEMFIKEIKGE